MYAGQVSPPDPRRYSRDNHTGLSRPGLLAAALQRLAGAGAARMLRTAPGVVPGLSAAAGSGRGGQRCVSESGTANRRPDACSFRSDPRRGFGTAARGKVLRAECTSERADRSVLSAPDRSAGSAGPARRLRGAGGDWPGRHGRGAEGVRAGPLSAGGHQDDVSRLGRQCHRPPTLHPGSPGRRRGLSRTRCRGSRCPRDRGAPLPGHAVRPGRVAATSARPRRAAAAGGHCPDRPANGFGAGRGSQSGPDPPGHQAGQPAAGR